MSLLSSFVSSTIISCEELCASKVIKVDNTDIRNIVTDAIDKGEVNTLRCLDTSTVDKMEYLFYKKTSFNADLSCWNVSAVTNMEVGLWVFKVSIIHIHIIWRFRYHSLILKHFCISSFQGNFFTSSRFQQWCIHLGRVKRENNVCKYLIVWIPFVPIIHIIYISFAVYYSLILTTHIHPFDATSALSKIAKHLMVTYRVGTYLM